MRPAPRPLNPLPASHHERPHRHLHAEPPQQPPPDALEEETIFILREVAAAFERPALLFSGGKDSLVMLCAEKAFGVGRIPYPLLMIDTGHNFHEVTDFRDFRAKGWAPSSSFAASRI